MGAAEDILSLNDLFRRWLIASLTTGAGVGTDVNVTNTFLTTHQDNVPADQLIHGPVSVTNLTADQLIHGPVTVEDARLLTERMLAKAPATGYVLYLDVVSTSSTHIYIAEVISGTATSATGFRGVRITLDASGNPLGAVATNTDFIWDNRDSVIWTA